MLNKRSFELDYLRELQEKNFRLSVVKSRFV